MFISDLRPGQIFSGFFLVKQKQLTPFKNKPGNFLALILQDRTGTVKAKVWDNADNLAGSFEIGDVVDISGSVSTYLGETQVVVTDLRKAMPGTYNVEDLLPTTPKDVGQMRKQLLKLVSDVSNPYLRQLLGEFFEREEVLDEFCRAPAAKGMHQAYLGGLLEHTLNIWEIAKAAATLYSDVVNHDLLLVGVLLHDVGKIREYSYNGIIDLTDEGRLLGHIMIGAAWVQSVIAQISGFPIELANRVLHMIISHHGRLEYGSPKRPKTVEACILHHADLMDSQAAHFAQLVATTGKDSRWSQFDRSLERAVFAGDQDENLKGVETSNLGEQPSLF